MRYEIKLAWIVGALAATVAGCSFELGESSSGDEGAVEFSYEGSCFFGCSMEQSLLVGTTDRIGVTGRGDELGVTVSSTRPEVATFAVERSCTCSRTDGSSAAGYSVDVADEATCASGFEKECNNAFPVVARAAGDTRLELHDADGEVIDRVTVRVREVDSVRIDGHYEDLPGNVAGDSFRLRTGQRLTLEADLYDSDSRSILASQGVLWTVGDTEVASLSSWLLPGGDRVEGGDSVVVEGAGQGTTTVTLSAPGADHRVTIEVDGD